MRIILLALFLATLALTTAPAVTQAPITPSTPSSPPKCAFRNLYTDFFKKAGIEFLKEPIFTNEQCTGEWKLHGSCCTDEDVEHFANEQLRLEKKNLAEANGIIGRNLKHIRTYLQTFEMFVVDAQKSRKHIDKLSTKKRRKMNNIERQTLRRKIAPKIIGLRKWLKANRARLVRNQKKCIKKLESTRINSVCYACSARAQAFFEKDNLRVNEETCRDIISQCSDSWLYLMGFLDKVNYVYSQVRVLEEKTGIRFSDSVKGSPASNILNWSDTNNFRKDLLSCKKGLCEFNKAKNICDNFVSIRKRFYLVNALTAVKSIAKKGEKLAKKAKPNPAKKGKKSAKNSPQNSKGRKLVVGKPNRLAARDDKPSPPSSKPAVVELKSLLEATQGTAVTAQLRDFNPLLCPRGKSCTVDKVILPVSRCGAYNVDCTKSTVSFNYGK